MLKTYRIIPLVFILFLFGFTLISVSPVIAEDSPEFIACQQINPTGVPNGGSLIIKSIEFEPIRFLLPVIESSMSFLIPYSP
jgi:hypothetical protein